MALSAEEYRADLTELVLSLKSEPPLVILDFLMAPAISLLGLTPLEALQIGGVMKKRVEALVRARQIGADFT